MHVNRQRKIRFIGLLALAFMLLLPTLVVAEVDITDKVEIIKGRMVSDRRTGDALIDVSVRNISDATLIAPVRVVIDYISDSRVTVANADGETPEGKPFYEYFPDLAPVDTSISKRWIFSNPNRIRFSYGLTVSIDSPEVVEVDASDVGYGLAGAEYQDIYGNAITCYISEESDLAELEVIEGYEYGVELSPKYSLTTNKFIKINYPSGYDYGRGLIRIRSNTPPDRVIVYDSSVNGFKLAPFVYNQEDGFVEIRTDIQNGTIGIALANINQIN